MRKSTTTYWNALSPENRERWTSIKGMEGMAEELTLSVDDVAGEYTRLTRFLPGANTAAFGGKTHPYPEEVFIVSGRLYDEAFDLWLDSGHYASRPPGELHGPFKTDVGCVVLEMSFPNRIADSNAAQPGSPGTPSLIFRQCIATMQYMQATLLARSKEVRDDGSLVEVVIWGLREPLPPSEHLFKYRLVYGAPAEERVRYDNERGKGDHRHVAGRELTYVFVSVDQLLDDFERDVQNWSSQ